VKNPQFLAGFLLSDSSVTQERDENSSDELYYGIIADLQHYLRKKMVVNISKVCYT
jgi:hypothetical protein